MGWRLARAWTAGAGVRRFDKNAVNAVTPTRIQNCTQQMFNIHVHVFLLLSYLCECNTSSVSFGMILCSLKLNFCVLNIMCRVMEETITLKNRINGTLKWFIIEKLEKILHVKSCMLLCVIMWPVLTCGLSSLIPWSTFCALGLRSITDPANIYYSGSKIFISLNEKMLYPIKKIYFVNCGLVYNKDNFLLRIEQYLRYVQYHFCLMCINILLACLPKNQKSNNH